MGRAEAMAYTVWSIAFQRYRGQLRQSQAHRCAPPMRRSAPAPRTAERRGDGRMAKLGAERAGELPTHPPPSRSVPSVGKGRERRAVVALPYGAQGHLQVLPTALSGVAPFFTYQHVQKDGRASATCKAPGAPSRGAPLSRSDSR